MPSLIVVTSIINFLAVYMPLQNFSYVIVSSLFLRHVANLNKRRLLIKFYMNFEVHSKPTRSFRQFQGCNRREAKSA